MCLIFQPWTVSNMSSQDNNESQNSGITVNDRDITVNGSFSVSRGAPICPVCKTLDIDSFTGRIPYPIAGFDISDWPTEPAPDRDPPFDPNSLYPFDSHVTGVCGCSEFVTYKMHVELDESRKPCATFEYEEIDRISRASKDRGALGWFPNYRN